ncbi:unnamed protein product [Arabidopsis thaliana]|uniref:(thale cress) hypothetical protein n=1 Tax=Arabidopsis thaliana TaxID=3702 RepID=A0A7G2EE18_ARATH|nr:unnamed protein product [Arabidopsis thaliana]
MNGRTTDEGLKKELTEVMKQGQILSVKIKKDWYWNCPTGEPNVESY